MLPWVFLSAFKMLVWIVRIDWFYNWHCKWVYNCFILIWSGVYWLRLVIMWRCLILWRWIGNCLAIADIWRIWRWNRMERSSGSRSSPMIVSMAPDSSPVISLLRSLMPSQSRAAGAPIHKDLFVQVFFFFINMANCLNFIKNHFKTAFQLIWKFEIHFKSLLKSYQANKASLQFISID